MYKHRYDSTKLLKSRGHEVTLNTAEWEYYDYKGIYCLNILTLSVVCVEYNFFHFNGLII